MDFLEFKTMVKAGVQDFLGENVGVQANQIRKNNGVLLDGLYICEKGVNISPTIYLNDFYSEYKRGKALSAIVYQIAKTYEEAKMEKNVNMNFFLDYRQVKGKLVYRLVNFEKNKEMLEKIPYIRYLDLAITFQCMIMNDRIGNATIQITDKHCEMWQVGEKELMEAASVNTPKYLRYRITSMDEVIKSILADNLRRECSKRTEEYQEEEQQADSSFEMTDQWVEDVAGQMMESMRGGQKTIPMYVLTNGFKINGASCLLYPDILKEFAQKEGTGLYILPSSVHEVILIPDSGKEDAEQLKEMVYDVNHTQVEEEEILSDGVYYYDPVQDEVLIVE